MNTVIQIRNVPLKVHRELKSRAAKEGMTLSQMVLHEIMDLLSRPLSEEIHSMTERLARIKPSMRPADAVRAERDSR